MNNRWVKRTFSIVILWTLCLGLACSGSETTNNRSTEVTSDLGNANRNTNSISKDNDKNCRNWSRIRMEFRLKSLVTEAPSIAELFENKKIDLKFNKNRKSVTFEGSAEGYDVIHLLIKAIDQYKSQECIQKIFFTGKNSTRFVWNVGENVIAKQSCNKESDLRSVIEDGLSGNNGQVKNNFDWSWDNGKLTLMGYLFYKRKKDVRGGDFREHPLKELIQRLRPYQGKNCITQVVFGKEFSVKALDSGFKSGFGNCGGDLCFCEGECGECPCKRIDPNTSKNTNTNTNSSNSNNSKTGNSGNSSASNANGGGLNSL